MTSEGMVHGAEGTAAKTPGYAWVILAVVFIASVVGPLNQFKVPPLAEWLFPAFGMTGATFGWLMTAMSVMGIVLAFPAAFICMRFGNKQTTLFALGCLIVGCFVGALAPNVWVMLLSRFIEGVGIGLVGISAPTIITIWFPEGKRGVALGIWGLWVPLGMTIMFNVAPPVAINFGGWQAVWWVCLALTVIAFILAAVFIKLPEGVEDKNANVKIGKMLVSEIKTLKNPTIWLLGLSFFVFNIAANGAVNTHFPTYLQAVWGMDSASAGSLAGVVTALGILAPVGGYLSDRLNTNKKIIVVGFVILSITGIILGLGITSMGMLWVFIILSGLIAPAVIGATRPAAPAIMGGTPNGASMGMGVLQFFQQLGLAIGAPMFGMLAAGSMGYAAGGWFCLFPCGILGIVFTLLMKWK